MKTLFLFLAFILPILTFAQSDSEDEIFEIRSDSAAIARQQLQSMMLVREFVIEGGYNPITKLMISEFNAFGQPTYIEKSPHFSADYDVYMLSYKIQERFEYSPQHRQSNYCYNYKKLIYCQQTEYDEAGNVTRLASTSESFDTNEIQMQWKAGKMVKATFKDPFENKIHSQRTMTEAGKIAEYSSDTYRATYTYSQTGNEETITIHTYLKDTLFRINVLKNRTDKDLPTYSTELNHKRDTQSVLIASYDTYGNATTYESRSYSYELDEDSEMGLEYAPKQAEGVETPQKLTPENKPKKKTEPDIQVEKLELVNDYSAQNLLTKRLIYRISPKGERTLMAIDRVIYDKDPLLVKPWYVEKENEYGEYGEYGDE
jgi:hypothetical protein